LGGGVGWGDRVGWLFEFGLGGGIDLSLGRGGRFGGGLGLWAWGVAWAVAIAIVGVGLGRGTWELIGGWENFFLGLWWGTWPLTLGVIPGKAAAELETFQNKAILLPTLAAGLGLTLGVLIYRTVHPV